jgi:hypothetical protein
VSIDEPKSILVIRVNTLLGIPATGWGRVLPPRLAFLSDSTVWCKVLLVVFAQIGCGFYMNAYFTLFLIVCAAVCDIAGECARLNSISCSCTGKQTGTRDSSRLRRKAGWSHLGNKMGFDQICSKSQAGFWRRRLDSIGLQTASKDSMAKNSKFLAIEFLYRPKGRRGTRGGGHGNCKSRRHSGTCTPEEGLRGP